MQTQDAHDRECVDPFEELRTHRSRRFTVRGRAAAALFDIMQLPLTEFGGGKNVD